MSDYIHRIIDSLKDYERELNVIYGRYNSNLDLSEWQRNLYRWRERFKNFIGEKITSEELEKFNNLYKLPFLTMAFRERVPKEFGSFSKYLSELIKDIEENCDYWMIQLKEKVEISDEEPLGTLDLIYRICEKFHKIALTLRKRQHNRTPYAIQNEYDVQDLFHALLLIFFDDIRTEEWTPSYAGSSKRIDFLFKDERIAVEIKMTSDKLRDRDVGDQLIIDIEHYKEHRDCSTLICFVYDPEFKISNPTGIEKDLAHRSGNQLQVRVLIRPYPG